MHNQSLGLSIQPLLGNTPVCTMGRYFLLENAVGNHVTVCIEVQVNSIYLYIYSYIYIYIFYKSIQKVTLS